ncbi:MAG TPA: ATP-binding protein [Thermoanaerobaculia bacterium]|nr:ATP-binding protein [Thermoanaerobaculia bacterium]
MTGNAVLREVTLTLPMLPDMEVAASKTATAMAEYMQMTPDRIDEVRMAVIEACINAFEHSHAPDRKVYMTFEVLGGGEPELLRISVRDTGIGFKPAGGRPAPGPGTRIGGTKRGWGLKIIQGLMDSVEIDSNAGGGTTVVMSKRRSAGADSREAGELRR